MLNPELPTQDRAEVRGTHAMLPGDDQSRLAASTKFRDGRCYDGVTVKCRPHLFSSCVASFFDHIGNIVQVCAEEKVFGIAARSVVASVQDVHSIRNGAIGYFERFSVCGNQDLVPSEYAITVGGTGLHGPKPTGFGAARTIYTFKEALAGESHAMFWIATFGGFCHACFTFGVT